jgi:hypothetical protein
MDIFWDAHGPLFFFNESANESEKIPGIGCFVDCGKNGDTTVWLLSGAGLFSGTNASLFLPESFHGLADTPLKPALIKF